MDKIVFSVWKSCLWLFGKETSILLDLGHGNFLHIGGRLLLSIILYVPSVLLVDRVGIAWLLLLPGEQICYFARRVGFLVSHDHEGDRDGQPVENVTNSRRIRSCVVPAEDGIEDLVAVSGVGDFWVT